MTSDLAAIVRNCAEQSIRGTLSTVKNLSEYYRVRTEALRGRLASLDPLMSKLRTKATPSQSELALVSAWNVAVVTLTAAETVIKVSFVSAMKRLRALPDQLIAMYGDVVVPVSFLATAATVCPRVDKALQPVLASVAAEASDVKLALDQRLLEIDRSVAELEKVARLLG